MPDLAELAIVIRSEQVEQAKRRGDELTATAKKLEQAAGGMGGAMGTADRAAGRAATSLTATDRAAGGATRTLHQTDDAARRTSRTFLGLDSQLRSLIAGFTALAVARQAISTLTSFGDTMAEIRGVAIDATLSLAEQEAQFARLEAAARQLGATTRFTAQEAASGLLELARAGLSTEQAIAAIPSVLNLAQAGQLQLAEAATITTRSLAQFGLQAAEAERVADALTKAANISNSDVRGLAEAFNVAAPIAADLGISIEETAAALAVLANSGRAGSAGGTALRQTLADLLDPTKEAQQLFQSLGLSMSRINPQGRTLAELFSRLQEAGLDVGEAVKAFEIRAAGSAVVLSQNVGVLRGFTEAIQGAGGETSRLAGIMDNTLGGSLKALRSAFDEAILASGESGLGGSLRFLVDLITDVIRSLSGVQAPLKTNETLVRALEGAVIGTAAALGTLLAINAAAFFLELGRSILFAATHLRTLAAAIAANPIGLIATAVGAAVAALVIFRDETISVGDQVTTLGTVALTAFDVISDAVIIVARLIGLAFTTAFNSVRKAIDSVASYFAEFFRSLGLAWSETTDSMTGFGREFANDIIALFLSIGDTFNVLIRRLFQGFFALAKFDFTDPIDSIKVVAAGLRDALDPGDVFAQMQREWQARFENDFIGNMIGAVETGVTLIGGALRDLVAEEFGAEGLAQLDALLNPLETFQRRLRERETERQRERRRAQPNPFEGITEESVFPGGGLDNVPEPNERLTAGALDLNAVLRESADALERARAAARADREEREALISVLGVEQQLRQSGVAITDQQRESLERLIEQERERIRLEESTRIADNLIESQRAIRLETEALLEGNGALEDRVRIALQLRDLTKLSIEDRERLAAEIHAESSSIEDLNAALEANINQLEALHAAEQAAGGIADAFTNGFRDILFGAEDLRGGLKGIFEAIVAETFELFAARQLRQAIQSLVFNVLGAAAGGGGGPPIPSARGNVIRSGAVVPFARGGIVEPLTVPIGYDDPRLVRYASGGLPELIDRPTVFPMRGGRMGIAGEAGPEVAIAPLTRTASGRLGVEAVQSRAPAQAQRPTVINQHITIQAQDAGSFHRSQRQVAAELRDAVRNVR